MKRHRLSTLAALSLLVCTCATVRAADWVWTTAYHIPEETHNNESGYFSIIEGKNGAPYIGTAKYGVNAYLVEFDPATKAFKVVVDANKEIGTTATGFAAQSKIHTRNNTGESGKIYVATKQGYPDESKGEKRSDYKGGYPMVYDPATGTTKVYPIPVPNHGIISITPDESRDLAYLSTCSDSRPYDNSHFIVLNLKTGQYTDLGDLEHMYAFIVVDHKGRAYHPIRGGQIARYDPATSKLDRLKQTIDGAPPTPESHLADPDSHPINWDISADRKTLYAVAMSGNQLYSYDLTTDGDTLAGKSLGTLVAGAKSTDCRAMCVGADGGVWMGVEAGDRKLHLVSYDPTTDKAPRDHGQLAIRNAEFVKILGEDGKPLPWRQGIEKLPDGTLIPRETIMGICKASNGKVYLTTIAPFTLHEIEIAP